MTNDLAALSDAATQEVAHKIWASIKRAMFKDAEPFFDEVAMHCILPHLVGLVLIDREGLRERVKICLRNIEKRATIQTDEIGNADQLAINCDKIISHVDELRAAIAVILGEKP